MKHPISKWVMTDQEFSSRVRGELLQMSTDLRQNVDLDSLRHENVLCFAYNLVATELEAVGAIEQAEQWRGRADHWGADPSERDEVAP